MDVDALIEGFEYDLWANLLWVEPARRSGQEDLFRHILAAQAVWLARCRDVPIGAATEGDLEEIARDQSGAWISYLRAADPGSPIRYRREEKDFVNPIHEIARHVVNHGT
ncbi:MAG: hypothetical protein HY248_00685, partial [Fimbriimonas ginsengisoli]|nr:hypothetical protein [Fimbriimonas ginsengisoli]